MTSVTLHTAPELSYAYDFEVKSEDVGKVIEWIEGNAKDDTSLIILLRHVRADGEKLFKMTVEYSGEHAQENAAKFKLYWM